MEYRTNISNAKVIYILITMQTTILMLKKEQRIYCLKKVKKVTIPV